MKERHVNGKGSVEAERLRRLRLSEFLRDLVRQEGKMEAAELLGVNHKTLTRAEESGEVTGASMGDALELLLRKADDAEVARLREAVGALEERVAALEGGMETPPAADAEDEGERLLVRRPTTETRLRRRSERSKGMRLFHLPLRPGRRAATGGAAGGLRCEGWTRRW